MDEPSVLGVGDDFLHDALQRMRSFWIWKALGSHGIEPPFGLEANGEVGSKLFSAEVRRGTMLLTMSWKRGSDRILSKRGSTLIQTTSTDRSSTALLNHCSAVSPSCQAAWIVAMSYRENSPPELVVSRTIFSDSALFPAKAYANANSNFAHPLRVLDVDRLVEPQLPPDLCNRLRRGVLAQQ